MSNNLQSQIKEKLPKILTDSIQENNSSFTYDEKTNRFSWKILNTILNTNSDQMLYIQGGGFNSTQLNLDNFNVSVEYLDKMPNKVLFTFCSGSIEQTFNKTNVTSFHLSPSKIFDENGTQFICNGFIGNQDECTTYDVTGNWLAIGY